MYRSSNLIKHKFIKHVNVPKNIDFSDMDVIDEEVRKF